MLNKTQCHFAAILLACLWAQTAFGAPLRMPQEGKKKLAVLKIAYIDFTKEEQELVNTAFYEHLTGGQRIAVVKEAQARAELLPLGIDPAEIVDDAGYIRAGQVLRVDYVLVGNMEKVGDFVEVTFRVFTMPRGTEKEYPGGKTLDLFVKQEIPKIVEHIQHDIGPPSTQPDTIRVALPKPPAQEVLVDEKKTSKRPIWPWIAIGGAAAGGTIAAVLLSSGGGEDKTTPQGLPRPPVTP